MVFSDLRNEFSHMLHPLRRPPAAPWSMRYSDTQVIIGFHPALITGPESRCCSFPPFLSQRRALWAIFLARLPQVPMSHQRLEAFFVRSINSQ